MSDFFEKLKKGMNLKDIEEEVMKDNSPEIQDIEDKESKITTAEFQKQTENQTSAASVVKNDSKIKQENFNTDIACRQAGEKTTKKTSKTKKSSQSKKTSSSSSSKNKKKKEKRIAQTISEKEEPLPKISKEEWLKPEGQLVIDVYETDNEIVIESAIAGVNPQELDISIENDIVVIKGIRKNPLENEEKKYFYQECYWGPFSREIILPREIDAGKAEAKIKNGILIIKMPKIEKEKKKLKIN